MTKETEEARKAHDALDEALEKIRKIESGTSHYYRVPLLRNAYGWSAEVSACWKAIDDMEIVYSVIRSGASGFLRASCAAALDGNWRASPRRLRAACAWSLRASPAGCQAAGTCSVATVARSQRDLPKLQSFCANFILAQFNQGITCSVCSSGS
jgi:hypothetical protein